jgi:beta-aspartyl-peptidase (threonine type)
MGKIAIVIHGGAGPDSEFIRQNKEAYEDGLKEAAQNGYEVLKGGGTAMAAVEKAVQTLEDNGIFNSGYGSALNINGEVEMDAAIMTGENLKAGAVSMVRNVKNPISLAKLVLWLWRNGICRQRERSARSRFLLRLRPFESGIY